LEVSDFSATTLTSLAGVGICGVVSPPLAPRILMFLLRHSRTWSGSNRLAPSMMTLGNPSRLASPLSWETGISSNVAVLRRLKSVRFDFRIFYNWKKLNHLTSVFPRLSLEGPEHARLARH